MRAATISIGDFLEGDTASVDLKNIKVTAVVDKPSRIQMQLSGGHVNYKHDLLNLHLADKSSTKIVACPLANI